MSSAQDKQEAVMNEALLRGLESERTQPQQEPQQEKTELIEQLTESDLVAADATLQNLETKDIPSANFDDAEAQEFRHYLDVVLERKRAAYPHEGQVVTGVLREWQHDDDTAGLEPVDKHDLLADETFKQGVAARITKGKKGSLIGLALRSVQERVSRIGGQSDDSSGILGRFKK